MAVDLTPRLAGSGTVTSTGRGWHLEVPAGGNREYRLAQLDDHAGRARGGFIWKPPLTFSLGARVSADRVPGTWGFGLWNDPFGLDCNPSQGFARVPALPHSIWYFSASSHSYLSLRDDKPANGLFAQAIRSAKGGAWMIGAALIFPFNRGTARRSLSQRVAEDAARVTSDPCAWHSYEIRWQDPRAEFRFDGRVLLESPVSPRPPLGFVVWIDNQYAAFEPGGRLAWGLESNAQPAWLEIEDLRCDAGPEPH